MFRVKIMFDQGRNALSTHSTAITIMLIHCTRKL